MKRRDDDPVRHFVPGQLAPHGETARPFGAVDRGENAVLREDVPAAAFEPDARAIAPSGEARRLQINPGHADKDIASAQPQHDAVIQRGVQQPLAQARQKPGGEALPCDRRQGQRQQRHGAFGGKRKGPGARPRHIGVEPDPMPEALQFAREVEHMEAPGGGDRDPRAALPRLGPSAGS